MAASSSLPGGNSLPSEATELRRLEITTALEPSEQAKLGQFFTPALPAKLIASMLTDCATGRTRLLDPGAGVGSLSAAAVEHFAELGVREIDITAWEIDEQLHPALEATLEHCAAWAATHNLCVNWDLRGGDYIEAAADELANESGHQPELFDAVITNPPYRKVNIKTSERRALERLGLPISNLYAAFLALAAAQLAPDGIIAAITPRSFTNGLYYAPFRRFFFDRVAITRIHLFESRTHVFADADVLQENVIFSAQQGARPPTIHISTSHGIDDQVVVRQVPAAEIIRPEDPQCFLRIPGDQHDTEIAEVIAALPATLETLDVQVSTGKVVEFRARPYLCIEPQSGAAPLVRPNHLNGAEIAWPAKNGHKPNALIIDPESEKLLLPNGIYVVAKRLTAKEEARRVRAAISDPSTVPGKWVAFENHLNVFHRANQGLPNNLAHGLAAYLNSTVVDLYVRQFNGHTQVNATDLRHLRYPNVEQLSSLSVAVQQAKPATQEEIDKLVAMVLTEAAPTLQGAA